MKKDYSEIKNIEEQKDFNCWAITDSWWDLINTTFSNYDDALDAYEDLDGYENSDINLSYITNMTKEDYQVHVAPLIY
ncbi:hypothetical protein [Lactobacillus sp.]|uniref:hypothetical protein n=1 Tax=Lactobacillus sp. TaxID=1591 RepID=UPI00198930EE|nr:hypothetical protein [Lactobacillus sp.]MBD5430485.1 hypothetical protein [Lactobacillus sp.]MBD5430779.1 hypothetical protein [Lactobacillus sp.]